MHNAFVAAQVFLFVYTDFVHSRWNERLQALIPSLTNDTLFLVHRHSEFEDDTFRATRYGKYCVWTAPDEEAENANARSIVYKHNANNA